MEDDPYRAPQVEEVGSDALISDVERIRREHLKHEASLQGAGSLLLLGSLGLGLALVTGADDHGRSGGHWSGMEALDAPVPVIEEVMFALNLVAGIGLYRLAPWARIPGLTVSALILLSFPLGTIFGSYFLFLMLAPKGRRILSPDYRRVIARTPDIRYQTPRWMWMLLLFIVALFVLTVVYLVLQ
jgi:hypothetical protein